MKQIIFESSPAFIALCLALGLGYAWLLYQAKPLWNKTLNWILFSFRAVLVFVIAFHLLGPIVKQIHNLFEKPVFVILQDNSGSIKETTDTLMLRQSFNQLTALEASLQEGDYETAIIDLSGEDYEEPRFEVPVTNIHEALRKISNRYEGRSVAGVLLVSDGIYNAGLSPLYGNYNFPVYTMGIGDTLQRPDLSIKNVVYNKIAYQGNKFPLRVEVSMKGFANEEVNVTLRHKGSVVTRQNKKINGGLAVMEFQPLAAEEGIQRWDIQVEAKTEERNTKNNHATVFIEVVEGKKKVLLIAAAPHPDIKALRTVIDKNSNYELFVYIPGILEEEQRYLQPDQVDLAVFHHSPDSRGRTTEIFNRFIHSRTPLFMVVGQSSDLNQLARQDFLKFDQPPRQFDEVTPVINPAFSGFIISTEANSMFTSYPPVTVHFGKIQPPPSATPLLFQQVGKLTTEKPLLLLEETDQRKIGLMMGDGLWRWRLHEYSKTENTEAFDEVFGKLIQYLSTSDDKSKFRSYPVKQQFSDMEPVVFESQVYNNIYEPVYGTPIELEITDEQGRKTRYNYITSPGNVRYQVGGLREGAYRYAASTTINQKREEVNGQFLVSAQQAELHNLTADFTLLRKLSQNTGGKFYAIAEMNTLQENLLRKEAQSIIRSEETYNSLINLKWMFFLLLLLATSEWFLRKYFGGY